jgi:hypothetical protein
MVLSFPLSKGSLDKHVVQRQRQRQTETETETETETDIPMNGSVDG